MGIKVVPIRILVLTKTISICNCLSEIQIFVISFEFLFYFSINAFHSAKSIRINYMIPFFMNRTFKVKKNICV